MSIPRERFQISINVIVQYFDNWGNLGEFPRVCCYPIDIMVKSDMLVQSIASLLHDLSYIDISIGYSFVFLLGEYNATTKSIHVSIYFHSYA